MQNDDILFVFYFRFLNRFFLNISYNCCKKFFHKLFDEYVIIIRTIKKIILFILSCISFEAKALILNFDNLFGKIRENIIYLYVFCKCGFEVCTNTYIYMILLIYFQLYACKYVIYVKGYFLQSCNDIFYTMLKKRDV